MLTWNRSPNSTPTARLVRLSELPWDGSTRTLDLVVSGMVSPSELS